MGKRRARPSAEEKQEQAALESGARLYEAILEVSPSYEDMKMELMKVLTAEEPPEFDELPEGLQDFFVDVMAEAEE